MLTLYISAIDPLSDITFYVFADVSLFSGAHKIRWAAVPHICGCSSSDYLPITPLACTIL